jgi:hypothetical protein
MVARLLPVVRPFTQARLPLPLFCRTLLHRCLPLTCQLTSSSLYRMATSDPPAPAARTFPTTGYDMIDPSILVEEETIPNYNFQRYYPVHLGEVFEKRYQVVGKLGYGASSTVWLCRDLM